MINCQRAGCGGHYAEDGYCDECGHRAPAGIAAPIPAASIPAASIPAASIPSARSGSSSSQLGTAPSGGSTMTRSGRSSTMRGGLGANLVVVPPVPLRDPASAVLTDPSVSESHRVCGKCGEPVGQGKDGKPGRAQGFCPRDRTPFSFVPGLEIGDVVSGRYEILGCIAHGGLGWIYLGRDRNISDAGSDRWVVLKGLINTGDADATAAAVAERRFLVEVDHPNIVKIHDFASHADKVTGDPVGYIVMEYVGGRSLKDLALAHRGANGRREPLPLPQVLAYAVEILPALGYLHDRGLLFCDFKPDNVIHANDQLKLIDLGAVRRIGDQDSALYGTPGYQAPELATDGPSISSDLYTVGRTLAVLSFDFNGFTSRFAEKLPEASSVPLLASEESYDRLLRRATHANPAKRFQSTADMTDQALGVLREVLSAADGQPRPATSMQFTPERATFGADSSAALDGGDVAAALPMPLVDTADPGAAFLATLSTVDPAATIAALRANAGSGSLEVGLRLVHALMEGGEVPAASAELKVITKRAHGDWRIPWYAGLIALRSGDAAAATREFGLVYDALPGEIAPRLALAAATELASDTAAATRRYDRVWRVDHGYPSAAFGLARMRARSGDRAGAVAVLDEVPDSSSQHTSARIASLRARVSRAIGALGEADLVDASHRLERLRLDAMASASLAVEMFEAAIDWLGAGSQRAGELRSGSPNRLLGQALTDRELRLGLERSYRLLASLETDTHARYALVDRANAVRPRTMV
jgi:serine/threonine-protein kinase PknG